VSSRRDELLDAAITLLGSQGVRAVTHRAVDSTAGLAAGSTSNYFRTRDSLFEAVVERFTARERANWEEVAATLNPRTPGELAEALGALARQMTGAHRLLTLARYALLVESAQYPSLRPTLAMGGAQVNLYFENWLRRVGSTDPDRDLRVLANFLTGRVLHELAIPDPHFDPTRDLHELIEVFLHQSAVT